MIPTPLLSINLISIKQHRTPLRVLHWHSKIRNTAYYRIHSVQQLITSEGAKEGFDTVSGYFQTI